MIVPASKGPGASSSGPSLLTTGWVEARTLLLRSESDGSAVLLLTYLTEEHYGHSAASLPATVAERIVYRYDPGNAAPPSAGTLTGAETGHTQPNWNAVDVSTWNRATGRIVTFLEQFSSEIIKPFEVDYRDGKLMWRRQPAQTAGRYVIMAIAAPATADGETPDLVAVLSAEKGPRETIMPFNPTGPSGQRYHQLFRRSDGQAVGRTVRLPRINGAHPWWNRPCWSPDGRYVVYSDTDLSRVCIVPSNIPGGPKR